jgi:hypothetical protein
MKQHINVYAIRDLLVKHVIHHSIFVIHIHVSDIIKNKKKKIESILGVNGGTCSNLGNGLFVCACPAGFSGN